MTGSRRGRTRRTPHWLVLAAALILLLAAAGVAAGQGVPGGPDLPPPDPTPAAPAPRPTPAPTPAPTPVAPSPTPSPTPQAEDPGPSDEELEAQRAEEEARQAALARQREREARRRAALARLQRERRERAEDFRALDVWAEAQFAVDAQLGDTVEALDGAAVRAAVAATAEAGAAADDDPARGSALIIVLLIASGLSAMLVALPMVAGRLAAARGLPASGRLDDQLIDRMTFVQSHRVELAGVSAGCLLVALLLYVGAI
jgi:hypothetical protein